MQSKQVRFGPVALTTTTTTNILNPGTTTGGTGMPLTSGNLVFLIRKITIGNKTLSAAQAALWLGATGTNAAGAEVPEFAGIASAGALTDGISVPAQSSVEKFFSPALRLDVADFLVGGAGTATALTLMAEGEILVD